MCRLFELSPSSEQNPETMDAEQMAKYNEYLASVIAKSKQRHTELASEAESRRRGQTNGSENKEDDDKSSSGRGGTESKDPSRSYQPRGNGSSSSSSSLHTNGHSSSSSSSYRRTDNHQPQQPYSSGQQSFRLAFPIIHLSYVNMFYKPHLVRHLPLPAGWRDRSSCLICAK